MTKTATLTSTLTPDKSTDLRATFDFHAVPFTTSDHLRVPFLDDTLAGLRCAALARMSAALIAPAGTGKTALLRRLRSGLPEARYYIHDVKVTGLSKRDMCREIALAGGTAPAGSYPMRVRRLRPRLHSRRRS
jgi:ABC-type transport system involved in cytochrome bd biosynthesis fused ATPase/permease subunit